MAFIPVVTARLINDRKFSTTVVYYSELILRNHLKMVTWRILALAGVSYSCSKQKEEENFGDFPTDEGTGEGGVGNLQSQFLVNRKSY